jgi:hypothetical protein
MTNVRFIPIVIAILALARPSAAQQRPLVTEDAEPIGAGRVLIEGGFDAEHDAQEPAYGLRGNLLRIPTIGVSVGISSIAEFQIDGAPFQRLSVSQRAVAPLSNALTFTGDSTHDVEDIVIGTKIRFMAETASRPALAFRFATKLPNAKNETGLGTDTTDFYASFLGAKTVQSIRVVGNLGVGIIGEPTNATSQNDELTYGLSFARAMTDRAEIVGELNGRWSVRSGPPPIGTESRSILKLGGRYTQGPVRLDAGLYFGLTTVDPTVGFTAGFTYVFNAFTLP